MSERLTDEELMDAERQLGWRTRGSISVVARETAKRAITELRARRAADLTADEREALWWVVDRLREGAGDEPHISALAVLDRLLAGSEGGK